MTLQLLPSEFPHLLGKFYFLFYQCSDDNNGGMKMMRWGPITGYPSDHGVTRTGGEQAQKVVVNYFNGIQRSAHEFKENHAQRASLIEFALGRWMAK